MELVRKKTSRQAFDQGCFSSQGFGRVVYFKQIFNAEFMYNIYKRGTTWKQFDLDWTIWALHEDNDVKHTWKVALNWKLSNRMIGCRHVT